MNLDIILLYTAVSFFYIISPGPAVFLAISNGITTDMKTVAVSSAGNMVGLFLLSSISMLGLGAILISSSFLFMVIKVIGAAYLIYLGIKQILSSKTLSLNTDSAIDKKRKLSSYFYESFFIAATNPKPILFFIAFFPQFINVNQPIVGQFFVLTSIFMALSFISLYSYGYISRSAKGFIAKPSVMKWFHRVTGGLFIIMGVSLIKLRNNYSQ